MVNPADFAASKTYPLFGGKRSAASGQREKPRAPNRQLIDTKIMGLELLNASVQKAIGSSYFLSPEGRMSALHMAVLRGIVVRVFGVGTKDSQLRIWERANRRGT